MRNGRGRGSITFARHQAPHGRVMRGSGCAREFDSLRFRNVNGILIHSRGNRQKKVALRGDALVIPIHGGERVTQRVYARLDFLFTIILERGGKFYGGDKRAFVKLRISDAQILTRRFRGHGFADPDFADKSIGAADAQLLIAEDGADRRGKFLWGRGGGLLDFVSLRRRTGRDDGGECNEQEDGKKADYTPKVWFHSTFASQGQKRRKSKDLPDTNALHARRFV